jgi:O-antigen ligase
LPPSTFPFSLFTRHASRLPLIRLSLLFNLPFILFRVHRLAFDTYTHIFLADHYRQHWWSLWEPRWYLGFSMASYPPLVHQLIALLSWPVSGLAAYFAPEPEMFPGAFRLFGEEVAFLCVLLVALSLFPLAIREFARVFVGPRAANYAAGLAIVLPALSLSAWAFGQLPTLVATVAALFALTRGYAFTRSGHGRWLDLAQAVALAGVTAAAHHAVFLFILFAGPLIALHTLRSRFTLHASRLLLWITLSALAVVTVLWPFLQWSHGQALQTPIDHPSRHNFLTDPLALWFFFWPMYGPLLVMMPWAVWWGLRRSRRRGALLGLFLILFVLGLGGTTPLPRWFFGAGWEWLTYDRFSFWAAIALLPFAGAALVWINARLGKLGRAVSILFLITSLGWAGFAGFLSIVSHSQPQAIDLGPIVKFLDEPAQRPYRYLTLGFGDQFAKLSALTDNGSVDGDYHTARELPELRASGLGSLDSAIWNRERFLAVLPFLAHPERYGVRWVFVYHELYIPMLINSGWHFSHYVGVVTAWERPDVPSVSVTPPSENRLAAFWWGFSPLAFLILSLALFRLQSRPSWAISREKIIQALNALRRYTWPVIMLLLSLWWVHVLRPGPFPEMYFTYQSILVFASDMAVVFLLIIWLVERGLRREPLRFGPKALGYSGLALIAACALSSLTSLDRGLTLAFTVHLLLLGGLYCLCLNDPPSPTEIGRLFGGALLAQAVIALLEAASQSTGWLYFLHLPWPGSLTAATSAASVAQNAEGARWLRAYGTLPHPNILGGVLLLYLGVVIERFLETGRRRAAWLLALALGVVSLVLTFSRAAWLGAGVMLLGGILLRPRAAAGRSFWLLLLVSVASASVTALLLLPFFVARATGDVAIPTEQRSADERVLFVQAGLEVIRARPWLGVGAGAFVESLAQRSDWHNRLEPVHNIFLLVTAETGVGGALALLGLGGAILWRLWHRRRIASLAELMGGLALLAALTVGLFDHFWWTLPPARTLFVIALGWWAGSACEVFSVE